MHIHGSIDSCILTKRSFVQDLFHKKEMLKTPGVKLRTDLKEDRELREVNSKLSKTIAELESVIDCLHSEKAEVSRINCCLELFVFVLATAQASRVTPLAKANNVCPCLGYCWQLFDRP